MTGTVETPAADTGKASEQRDYQDDEQDSSKRHRRYFLFAMTLYAVRWHRACVGIREEQQVPE